MLLRDHPLMSYRGVPSWPPTWIWLDGPRKEHPIGELGILKSVLLSKAHQADRCFLLIFYKDSSYLGRLLFDDRAFCSQIVNILRNHCDYPIAEIGSLDLTYTSLNVPFGNLKGHEKMLSKLRK
jgi:hypothetical protein